MRHELTPLTSFTFDVGRTAGTLQLFSAPRHPIRRRPTSGLRFERVRADQRIRAGRAVDYAPLSSDLPRYTGSIASVNLLDVALGATRLGVVIGRDIEQSFDFNQPYYLQTGIAASIGQQIYGPLDVQARIGTQRLAYRDRAISVTVVDRQDKVRSYGGGIGYRLGRDLRLGFNVDKQRRESLIHERRYEGLKYGMAVSFWPIARGATECGALVARL